jgi:hypothetical protein
MPVSRRKSSFWEFASPRRRWWPVLSVGAALLIAVSVVSPAGRHQWALSLFRQPARFTTLAFKYAWLLPTQVKDHQRIPVFFTIGNQEGRPLRYSYTLLQSDQLAGSKRALSEDSAVVAAGATWTVDTSVRPDCSVWPCRIEVLLPGHPERIDFVLQLEGLVTSGGQPHTRRHKHHHARSGRT